MLNPKTHFIVTAEELDQIKNDCAAPERLDCENCIYKKDGDLPCTFKGANALMDEVMSRTLELELKNWSEFLLLSVWEKAVKKRITKSEGNQIYISDLWVIIQTVIKGG